jgi:uncharacterized protein YacL
MNLLHISSAVVWVDFFTQALSKVYPMTKALDMWYKQYHVVAVINDCLVIILGILIAQFIHPNASTMTLAITSVIVQVVHDYLFYIFVILGVPKGQNTMIDLMKSYASEGGHKIIIADSIMIASTVFLGDYLKNFNEKTVLFVGLLGAYALTYILYTHRR